MSCKPFVAIGMLLFFSSVLFAAYPSGLVSYWPFDSNANDAMGVNNGNIVNATLNSTGGKVAGAYDFKIALNNINFNASPSLDFAAGSSFTYAGYFKSSYNATDQRILYKFNGTEGNGYAVFLQSNGEVWGVTWSGSKSNVTKATGVNYCDGQWHQFAFVRDQQNGLIQLYIDGALKNSISEPQRGVNNSARLGFGIDYGFGSLYFNGTLDEMALFNRSLNASEISQYYNNSKDGIRNYFGDCRHACAAFGSGNLNDSSTAAVKSVFANVTLNTATTLKNFTFSWNGTNYSFYDPSLVGMWSFEDMNYSDNFDSGINSARWNNNNGVTANAGKVRYTIPSGSSSTARALSSYGTMYFSGDFDMQVDFTEVSTSDATESDYALRLYDYANASHYYEIKKNILSGTDYYQMYCSDTQAGINATALTSGKFRLVRSGSTITSYYYDSGAWKQTASCSTTPASFYVWLGAWNWGSYPALTVDFDNFQVNSGQFILDSSRSSNNGSFAGLFSTQAGKYGNALAFSATGYASTPVNLASYNAYSVSLWVKPAGNGSGSNGRSTIIGQDNVGDRVFTIEYDPSHAGGLGGFYTYNGNNSISGSDLQTGVWTHVVVVENKTGHW
ncbi:MAG TPA: LamG domain-containing protein, partial [Candidatus Micrarchaeota archaeon]|nr:LamG domain-containing protein [Candidatus Micrarchaeota archaeon]